MPAKLQTWARHVPLDRPCPNHFAVWAVMRCPRCAGVFWSAQAKLKELEANRAV